MLVHMAPTWHRHGADLALRGVAICTKQLQHRDHNVVRATRRRCISSGRDRKGPGPFGWVPPPYRTFFLLVVLDIRVQLISEASRTVVLCTAVHITLFVPLHLISIDPCTFSVIVFVTTAI